MKTEDRILANLAMEKLEQGWDEKAAEELIRIIRTLPEEEKKPTFKLRHNRRSRNTFLGHTAEAGDVPINDDGQPWSYHQFGKETVHCIGNYRVLHHRGLIYFYHFWGSELTTQGLRVTQPRYLLSYGLVTSIPMAFASLRPVPILILKIPFSKYYLVITNMKQETVFGNFIERPNSVGFMIDAHPYDHFPPDD